MSGLLGKAQLPSAEHPLGVAACGTPITPGLVVWTNNMTVGKVVDDDVRFAAPYWDGWFDVRGHEGACALQNQERVTTSFEGRTAAAEYARTAPRYELLIYIERDPAGAYCTVAPEGGDYITVDIDDDTLATGRPGILQTAVREGGFAGQVVKYTRERDITSGEAYTVVVLPES